MKPFSFFTFILVVVLLSACGQTNDESVWTESRLEEPEVLAKTIQDGDDLRVLINIGPGAIIPNSIDAGMTGDSEGMDNLKSIVSTLDKDEKVVIYCGCCPFAQCPNIRPAIQLLKEQKFSNFALLNLPQNINADWISKGYPVNRK